MKKILTLALAVAFTAPVLAAEDVLILATNGTYPPFSEIDSSGKMIGFDIDIGLALCAQMKRECRYEA